MIKQQIKKKSTLNKIGKTPVVILPLEEYEKMKEEIDMLSSEKLVRDIEKARVEVRKGEIYSIEEVKRKLKMHK